MLTHIAKDQYGHFYPVFTGHPRKALMNTLGKQHADNMYADTKDGKPRHIGYIIGGLWLRVWKTEGFRT